MEKMADRRQTVFDRKAQDRWFPSGQCVVVRRQCQRKLELPGQPARVVKQLTHSVVEIERGGEVTQVNVDKLSAMPMPSQEAEAMMEDSGNQWADRLRPRTTGRNVMN
jgi:hypothetical protein